MADLTSKTVAVFSSPFTFPGVAETLPAGDYQIETELVAPPDRQDPAAWKASVLVKLHSPKSHAGLAQALTVSLADLDHVCARDKLTGRALSGFFLEEMLADPMIRLVMKADGVSEAHLRHLYSEFETPVSVLDAPEAKMIAQRTRDNDSIRAAENEGMPSRSETWSPSPARVAAHRYDREQRYG